MGNTKANTDKKETWFWNQSANELEFDPECNGYFDEKRNLGPKGSKTEEKASPQKQSKEIK